VARWVAGTRPAMTVGGVVTVVRDVRSVSKTPDVHIGSVAWA
jgi:hypothetical protein